ncbi:MAG: InlB B-repeat-containing protein [Lachnospiraceae bacterium]|nr:InlB B-repeat-containing protein [Lachnospiraceae bacterium]
MGKRNKKIIVGIILIPVIVLASFIICQLYSSDFNIIEMVSSFGEDRPAVEKADDEVVVYFHINCKDGNNPEPIVVKRDTVLQASDMPKVSRDGYYFAGWYTEKKPHLNDAGYYDDQWIAGKKYMDYGGPKPKEGELTEMPVNSDLDLYAHWEAPVKISSAKDLSKIKKNLYGYYVLSKDIDLSSNKNFEPIGVYEAEYEYTNPDWWFHGFRGRLDGNGHKVVGLTFNNGGHANALIAAAANATIQNLTIDNYRICGNANQGIYTAPLLAFGLGNDLLIENCHTNGNIDLTIKCLDTDMVYSGITGLTAGCWGGQIRDCSARGNIHFSYHVANGSEINIGGINGEGYTKTQNCNVDMDIRGDVLSDASPINGQDSHGDIYIGMIQGAATVVEDCNASGTIEIGYDKKSGEGSINVGGIVGQERYDTIRNNYSDVKIQVNKGRCVYGGGIVGSYNTGVYGMIGAMSGIKENNIEHCTSAGSITLSSETDREDVVIGEIVSKLPEGIDNPMLKMFMGNDGQPTYKLINNKTL